jgi:dihydroorotase
MADDDCRESTSGARPGTRASTWPLAVVLVAALSCLADARQAGAKYDLVLRGGHVIDPRNGLDVVRDVAISQGQIAALAPQLDPADATRTVDVSGLYVTPGLVDIHTHVYAGTGEKGSYAGDNSVYPDGFTFRAGVTTIADAGSSGWRNFDDFNDRIITRSKTRVLAFLNIVGHGMRGGAFEQDLNDMEARPTADMARRHSGLIVGIKTAHYAGPAWTPVERGPLAAPPAGITAQPAAWQDGIRLHGYTLTASHVRPGGQTGVTLYWQTDRPIPTNYKVFVQLVGEQGLLAGFDAEPGPDAFPTSLWPPGQVFPDRHPLQVPAGAPAGT